MQIKVSPSFGLEVARKLVAQGSECALTISENGCFIQAKKEDLKKAGEFSKPSLVRVEDDE